MRREKCSEAYRGKNPIFVFAYLEQILMVQGSSHGLRAMFQTEKLILVISQAYKVY